MNLLRWVFPRDVHHVAGLHQTLCWHLPARGRVLDLGCGTNSDLEGYRTVDREVWGTDFHRHPQLQHAQWFRSLEGDGSIPFPDSHFDVVASIMVLEHVAAPRRFFEEVARVLRPGGRFIAHTISGTHYVTLLRRIVGLLPHTLNQALVKRLYGRAEVDTFPAFYRLNTARRLGKVGAAAGLQLTELQRYADPGYFRFARLVETMAILTDRFLEGLCAGWGRLYLTAVMQKPLTGRTSASGR